VIQEGLLPRLDLAPGQSQTLLLPVQPPALQPGAEYFLRVSFHLSRDTRYAPAGHEVAWQQLALPYAVPPAPPLNLEASSPLQTSSRANQAVVSGEGFAAVFNRAAGRLTSLTYGEQEVLFEGQGPRLNLFRALVDNDVWFREAVLKAGLDRLTYAVEDFQVERLRETAVRVTVVMRVQAAEGGFLHTALYTVWGNGVLDIDNRLEPYGSLPPLPRIGLQMVLDPALDRFTWLGRGPRESYWDRKRSVDVGLYHGKVADQYEFYVRPQENGNKEDVRWAALTDAQGRGLLVVADGLLSLSAHHFTAEDFHRASHAHLLRPRKEVVLCLDYRQMGLGGASCGPPPLPQYLLQAHPCRFRFSLRPYDPAMGPLSRLARQTVPVL